MRMATEHCAVDIYDYSGKKLCCLYDSDIEAEGQAHDIIYTDSLEGKRTLKFTLPFNIHKRNNYRWDFIKPEYLVRTLIGTKKDWFILDVPTRKKQSKSITDTVTCSHLSTILKTKNLYMHFDDTNGIGDLPTLMRRILKGTTWTFDEDHSDIFKERDNETIKIRSISSGGKDGAYKLITTLCDLFGAYPIFNADERKVICKILNKRGEMREMMIGKDLNALTVKKDSSSIVTRLCVEGQYTDDQYVSIDKVHPNGLSYIFNFDYYKELGLFTQEHQDALDAYIAAIGDANATVAANVTRINELEDLLNNYWGQIDMVYFPIRNRLIDYEGYRLCGNAKAEDATIGNDSFNVDEDALIVLQADGTFRRVTELPIVVQTGDWGVAKFIDLPAGTIGAKQVAIKTKTELLRQARTDLSQEIAYQDEIEALTGQRVEDKINAYTDQITKLEAEIAALYAGTEDSEGLYLQMDTAVKMFLELYDLYAVRDTAVAGQDDVEATFAAAMGDMLKEGYWSNTNYAEGQEQELYDDALEVAAQMARPAVTYTVDRVSLAGQMGYKPEDLKINMQVHLYDDDMDVNEIVFISETSRVLDDPVKDDVTLSNQDIRIQGVTLDSILSRMSKLADLVDQKNALYERANSINSDGSIQMDRLEGQIDILKTKLLSTRSNWYTDDSGNLIFEAANGQSAMMLTGEGFMIAAGKDDDGAWNWRSFGDGTGFTADAITTGYLSADRIEARSITANHLASDVGSSLNLSSNTSINLVVQNAVEDALQDIDIEDLAVYTVEIIASAVFLTDSVSSTTLRAQVRRGAEDVTASIDAARFVWHKESADGTEDTAWGQNHSGVKAVTVTRSDINSQAIFRCEILEDQS